jgi:hypothetical protein
MLPQCKDCLYWVSLKPWQGNCKLRPTPKPQWSESADPASRGCQSFTLRVQPGIYKDGKLVQAI